MPAAKTANTSIRISSDVRSLTDRLAETLGISLAAVHEIAIRKLARLELIPPTFEADNSRALVTLRLSPTAMGLLDEMCKREGYPRTTVVEAAIVYLASLELP